jgi:hypothetical protein
MPAAITDRWTSSGSLHDVTTDGNNPIVCHVLHGTKESTQLKLSLILVPNTMTKTMFVERLVIPECKQNMTSLRGQPSWAKMMSLRGKLRALACQPTNFVNKAE